MDGLEADRFLISGYLPLIIYLGMFLLLAPWILGVAETHSGWIQDTHTVNRSRPYSSAYSLVTDGYITAFFF